MYGKGMSPRKAMASSSMSFDVDPLPGSNAIPHPDRKSNVGAAGAMPDSERAVGLPIHHAPNHLPAQAAPRHGPHNDDGRRDGKA